MGETRTFFGGPVLLLIFKFDAVNEALRGVFKDDELVRNDAIDDPLLLCLRDIVDVAGFVELSLAATLTFVSFQHLVDADVILTAGVIVLGAIGRRRHLDFRRLLMEAALAHLGDWIIIHAMFAFDQVQV